MTADAATYKHFAQPSRDLAESDRRFAAAHGRERKTWQVSKVWDLHHQIIQRIFLGQKNTVIAKELGCTEVQVSNVRNSEIVQAQLAEMRAKSYENTIDIRKQINELAPKAVEVLETLLENSSTPANVKLNAARDVLDRGGHAAPQQVTHLHGHFSADDLEAIKQRAARLAENDSSIIDVTPTPETSDG